MEHLLIPENYHSELDQHDTQIAIKTVKDFFQNLLSERLHLRRVSAPLFVDPDSGLKMKNRRRLCILLPNGNAMPSKNMDFLWGKDFIQI